MRNTFIDTIIEQIASRDDIFVISGDAGLGVFDKFQVEYPERFLNMGVAEQNTMSFAAGLAMSGRKVLVYNIIPFALYRCYEQVRNDVCYQRLPVIIAGIGSGVTYAPGGMTHYSVEDLGLARTLPNLEVFSPVDPIEAKLAARYALDADGPVYVRLAKRGEPVLHERESFDITAPQVLKDGERIALVFHGSIGEEVVAAREELASENRNIKLVAVPRVQPVPFEQLDSLVQDCEHVVVVEEHYKDNGLAAGIAFWLATGGASYRLHSLGIEPGFIHEIKHVKGMRDHFGISAAGIADYVRQLD